MATPLVSINGRLYDYRQASISIFDYTLHCAIGLFESILAVDDRIIYLDEHLDRMEAGLTKLNIRNNYDRTSLTRALKRTVRAHPDRIKKVKVILTHGYSDLWPGNRPGPKMITIVMKHRLEFKKQKLMVSPMVITSANPMRGLKSLSFMTEWMSQHRARQEGYDQGIIINQAGQIAETGSANLFVVRKGSLYTPPVGAGGLPGIVRSKIIKIAQASDLPCHEKKLTPENLISADEIFTTSSFKLVWPVVALKLDKVYEYKPGAISLSIYKRLKENALTGIYKDKL